LLEFQHATKFQRGIVSLIVGIMQGQKTYDEHEMIRIFHKLDLKQDGFISYNELKSGFGDCLMAQNYSDEDWQTLFKKIDMNGQGKINYQEFLTAAIDHCQVLREENLQHAFKLIDTKNEGCLNYENMKEKFHDNSVFQNQELWKTMVQDIVHKEVDKYQINYGQFKKHMTLMHEKCENNYCQHSVFKTQLLDSASSSKKSGYSMSIKNLD
jgi:calcium-dependent protein kinase